MPQNCGRDSSDRYRRQNRSNSRDRYGHGRERDHSYFRGRDRELDNRNHSDRDRNRSNQFNQSEQKDGIHGGRLIIAVVVHIVVLEAVLIDTIHETWLMVEIVLTVIVKHRSLCMDNNQVSFKERTEKHIKIIIQFV